MLRTFDGQQSVILVLLLDLSEVFDTVDHSILLTPLSQRFGVKITALNWFSSRRSEWKQILGDNGATSWHCDLSYEVPKVPFLALAISDVNSTTSWRYPQTRTEVPFLCRWNKGLPVFIFGTGKNEDRSLHMHKMNRSKTELLILKAKHYPPPPFASVTIVTVYERTC